MRLLNRTTRRVSLTEVGRAYYERCTGSSMISRRLTAAGLLQTAVRGHLRVFAGAPRPLRLAGDRRFLRRLPEPRSTERQRPPRRHGRGRLRPRLRAAQPLDSEPDRAPPRPLAPRRVRRAVLSRKHGTPQQLADLRQHNCLRWLGLSYDHVWHLTAGVRRRSRSVSDNLSTNSAPALRAPALDGRGLVLAPTFIGFRSRGSLGGAAAARRPRRRLVSARAIRRAITSRRRCVLSSIWRRSTSSRHRAEINPDSGL